MEKNEEQCLPALRVAQYIISTFYKKEKEIDENVSEGVSNLKLQKLLCFCQAYSLVRLNRPMFSETIYAWKYGPVVKEIYRRYSEHKNRPIPYEESSLGEENEKVVNEMLECFGEYSATRLMGITHSHKPWKDMERKVLKGRRDIVITHKSLKKYYDPILT